MIQATTEYGCKSPLDTECICTDKFLNVAAKKILNDCPAKDAVGALDVVQEMCPNLKLPDLTKLSECTLPKVIDTLKSEGCAGPTDTGCICTEKFLNTATKSVLDGCPAGDAVPALDLVKNICPDMPLPDLSKLSQCTLPLVIGTLKSEGCAGPNDKGCICTEKFLNAATKSVLDGCPATDAMPALDLVKEICPEMPLPDLGSLSQCTLPLVIGTLKSEGCAGPNDKGCICTEKFINAATKSVLGGCPGGDAVPALKLVQDICPELPLPDLGSLPPCTLPQVIETLKSQNCSGPMDKNCICSDGFLNVATRNVLGSCSANDALGALDLVQDICPDMKLPDLRSLSECTLPQVTGALMSEGCGGPTDTACICTDKFLNAATQGILSNCPANDTISALDLVKGICPDMRLPDLGALPSCTLPFVTGALQSQKCAGPTDLDCICGEQFLNVATHGILDGCAPQDAVGALNVVHELCPDLPLPNLGTLPPCTLPYVTGTLQSQNCAGPLDNECLCGEPFLNAATHEILGNCAPTDAVGALKLLQTICPQLELPDLSKLPECSLGCVTRTLQSQNCAGPLDKNCLCAPGFAINAGGCLLGQCQLQGTGSSVGLLFDICRPTNKPGCNATGLWRLTQLSCVIPGFGKRDFRNGTPAVMQYRRLLE